MINATKVPWIGILLMASAGLSQTPVTTGGGTTNSIPVFTGGANLGNSVITQSNGNIGIGLTNPAFLLDVGGAVRFNWWTVINAPGSSNVNNPALLVSDQEASAAWMVPYASISSNATSGVNITPSICGANAGSPSNCGYFGMYYAGSGSSSNYLTMGITGSDHLLNIFQNGNVGIGTTTPGTDLASLPSPPVASTPILEVNGDIAFTQNKGGQLYFPDGTVQATAWNGTTIGGDYAEAVDVRGARDEYSPGDLIAIDDAEAGRFSKSAEPYSRLVAGVYSTKPGLTGRRTTAPRLSSSVEVPMALIGIVPVKATTENGAIKRGDLIVSSSRPGYGMKGTDRDRLVGAVIGKALGELNSGTGVIEVLLAIQ